MLYLPQETLESLERTIEEIQALAIIYGDTDNDDTPGFSASDTSFKILTDDDFQGVQDLVGQQVSELSELKLLGDSLPTLRVEVNLKLQSCEAGENYCIKIHIALPQGYPNTTSAIVSIISITNLSTTRSRREQFTSDINGKAKELADSGCEALLELIQYAQDKASQYLYEAVSIKEGHSELEEENDKKSVEPTLSRRWIWVHHITNNNRCKHIVNEAKSSKLRGYLKRGYPGVVVVEGDSNACDEYVQWIKGNKSRPGGFGRNWGHHVRGEESDVEAVFVNEFQDIGEELSDLGAICRQAGVESEFKKYVMQH